jgi:hypothetical protein
MSVRLFKFLSITGLQTLVGSSADDDVIYSADYDLMEQKDFKKTNNVYEDILTLFRKKYIQASKPNSNIWIIDFKCGMFRGQPIRWDKESIKLGYVVINDEPKYFVDCLQQESRIKMDVIATSSDGVLNEYSDIYFIRIGDRSLSREINEEESAKSIYSDFHYYIEEKNYYKALKRLYSYAKITNNKPLIKELLKVINSNLGINSKMIADLGIISALIDNNFKNVNKKLIVTNLSKLNIQVAKNKSLTSIKEYLEELISKYMHELNNAVVEVVKSNKLLNSYFHF